MPPTLRTQVLQLLQRPDYRPLDKVELSKALRMHSSDRRVLREVLGDLETAGEIVKLRKDRYGLPRTEGLLAGKVQVHRNGTAHFQPETAGQAEVFLTANDLGTALHGDKVQVRLKQSARDKTRREGVVVKVLERATERVVGLVQQNARKQLYLVPDDARFARQVALRPSAQPLPEGPRVGDKAVARLLPWHDPRTEPEAELLEVLGPAGEPGIDMLSIVRKFDLPTEFPPGVLAEAETIPERIAPAEIAKRTDLRDRLVFTIDPDDARDFDDAIDVTTLRGDDGEISGWKLGVHIADVSHYVRPGTELDREAQARGNSTYLADRVLPMLPERLSNGICSLKPGVERLTVSAWLEFNRAGKVRAARFGKSVIRSAARLSYRQAFAVLQGKEYVPPLPPSLEREGRGLATLAEGAPVRIEPEVAGAVREAWELASLLRRKRFEHGSLDLDFPEVKVWLDDNGKAVRLEKVENDQSHQLIEEFMLAANEAVAHELKNRLVPSIYRIHEDPDPERLQTFRELAVLHGIRVGDLTQRREVQKALAGIRGMPEEYALKLNFLRSLKRAAYSPQPLGHYGLAKVNYTHFTSPIRRYADLLVHRALAKAGLKPAELGKMAEHISETERVSSDAEKESVQLKKIEYFQLQLASRKPEAFSAVVTEVLPFGLRIELPAALMSGMIHVTALPEDYYLFDSVRRSFVGRKTKRRFKMGDVFQVIPARVDAARRQVDFAVVEK